VALETSNDNVNSTFIEFD